MQYNWHMANFVNNALWNKRGYEDIFILIFSRIFSWLIVKNTDVVGERVENSFSGGGDREIVHFAPKNVIGRRRKVVALRG